MFPRCILRPRWGWYSHWRCVWGPPGGGERHADPQRAAVHVLRRPHRQSLRPGGECWRSSAAVCLVGSINCIHSYFKMYFSECNIRVTLYLLLFLLQSHKCVAVFEGHSSKVSCLFVSAAPCLHHRLYSGSSDQTIRCYSLKVYLHYSTNSLVCCCLHGKNELIFC